MKKYVHCHSYVVCFGSLVPRKSIFWLAPHLSRFAWGLLKRSSHGKKSQLCSHEAVTTFI